MSLWRKEAFCRVVYVSPHLLDKKQVGAEFTKPSSRFWDRLSSVQLDNRKSGSEAVVLAALKIGLLNRENVVAHRRNRSRIQKSREFQSTYGGRSLYLFLDQLSQDGGDLLKFSRFVKEE